MTTAQTSMVLSFIAVPDVMDVCAWKNEWEKLHRLQPKCAGILLMSYNKSCARARRFLLFCVFHAVERMVICMKDKIYEKNLCEFKNVIRGKKLYLFGAGQTCEKFLKQFPFKFDVENIFDNDTSKVGNIIENIIVQDAGQIDELLVEKCVFLITTYYANEIKTQLENQGIKYIFHFNELGFNRQNLFIHPKLNEYDLAQVLIVKSFLKDELSKETINRIINIRNNNEIFWGYGYSYHPFFANDLLRLQEDEVMVDGGAFDGDTVREFHQVTHNRYQSIYAFEPDASNFLSLYSRLKTDKRIKCINIGLWKNKDKLKFVSSKDSLAHLSEKGEHIVNVDSLDALIDEKITFIKLDIEGAELEALKGARETILKYKPKLAIAIYHKHDDLWRIPLWIKQLVPEYKLYIRHHSYACDDTVLYAIIN